MKDFENIAYHQKSEEIVNILCQKTHNNTPLFYRIQTTYYFAKLAASMHTMIDTKTRGILPVNIYAINLAHSGFGKGHATYTLEHELLDKFYTKFIDETLPTISKRNITKLATEIALKSSDGDTQKEFDKLEKAYEDTGEFRFSIPEATTPAIKQLIDKINLGKIGCISSEVDELGNYIRSFTDVLTLFLETYDQGIIKPKLIKNTAENKRMKEIRGKVPTNLLMFGTPTKLLNGDKEEEEFYSLLETGYARRCLFGIANRESTILDLSPAQIYERQTNHHNNLKLISLSEYFKSLADTTNYNKTIEISREVMLINIEYQQYCEKRASKLKSYEELKKTELIHRYFKVLKLAGIYAFIDGEDFVSEDNMYAAIKLVEESGEAFSNILNREKSYVKLAKFIAERGEDITQVELTEALPFYKGTVSQKADLINLAIAYGYKNHIMIQKTFINNIEFFSGKSLKQTNLDELIVSYSSHHTSNYNNVFTSFDNLKGLFSLNDKFWLNHHLDINHRNNENIKTGFNLVVLDVDGSCRLKDVISLLEKYTYYIYTTKRHTDESNRFRIVLPINYILELSQEDFKQFMFNIYDWFPYELDTDTHDRCRAWAVYGREPIYKNEGILLDALPFIPKTAKNEEYKNHIKELKDFNNLERWFAQNIESGNRNNTLLKYAYLLADNNWTKENVIKHILNFNDKISEPLNPKELEATIFKSLSKKYT